MPTRGAARKQANAVLRKVDAGVDPQAEKLEAKRVTAEERRGGATFADLAEKWLESRAAKEWKPKTRAEFARVVRVELVPALGLPRLSRHRRAIADNRLGLAPRTTASAA